MTVSLTDCNGEQLMRGPPYALPIICPPPPRFSFCSVPCSASGDQAPSTWPRPRALGLEESSILCLVLCGHSPPLPPMARVCCGTRYSELEHPAASEARLCSQTARKSLLASPLPVVSSLFRISVLGFPSSVTPVTAL